MVDIAVRALFFTGFVAIFVEACVAERLTPGILDLEVWGSSVVSLDKELCFTLSLFTQRYKWVPATHY